MLVSIQVIENFVMNIQDNQGYTLYQSSVHFPTTTSYIHNAHLHTQLRSWKLNSKNTENKASVLPIPNELENNVLSSNIVVLDELFGKKKVEI